VYLASVSNKLQGKTNLLIKGRGVKVDRSCCGNISKILERSPGKAWPWLGGIN